MPSIMIKCPKTGKALPTGISMPKESFDDPTNVFTNNSTQCPHCGQMHVWNKSDAFVAAA